MMNLSKKYFGFVLLLIFVCGRGAEAFFGYSEDYCAWPLLEGYDNVKLTATSKLPGRGPEHAKIDSTISWTSASNDFDQYLQIDLGMVKNMTGIGTKGRSAYEYVREFTISFAINEFDYSNYKENDGSNKLFKGNNDGDTLHMNEFQTPIIAQYIRINPTRWHDRISMRVELYGCDYVSETLYFNGSSLVYRNLTNYPIQSRKDSIKFRFKTAEPDGILIYSKGTQSDFFALQLIDNRLVLNINLGTGPSTMTSLTAGSLLDDNLWHDVIITRFLTHVAITVDRVEIKSKIKGDFMQLDLDKIIYIGGSPFVDSGLVTAKNFTGCIENLYLNDTNVIYKLKNPPYSYYGDSPETFHKNHTFYNCPEASIIPVSFLPSQNLRSYIKLKGYEGIQNMNVSFEFRTWQDFGVVFYHKFTSVGFTKLYFEKSKLLIEIQSDTAPRLVLDNFPSDNFNDGLWHRVIYTISTNAVTLSVDERMVKTSRLLKIYTGGIYHFGGTEFQTNEGLVLLDSNAYSKSNPFERQQQQQQMQSTSTLTSTNQNYIGCLRQISIDGNLHNPSDFEKNFVNIVLDSCQMVDKCNPNPCEHGGVCKQNSFEFECVCDENYTGATCHVPLFPLSCEAYRGTHTGGGNTFRKEVTIDIDGSGPLAPFPVSCQYYHDGTVETVVHHGNEDSMHVDGYEGAGSWNQDIHYDANWGQIELLLNRSSDCRQWLKFECKNSRLFNSPSTAENFSPSSYWISRQNTPMDYWAGGLQGSRKCECGILGQCEVPDKWCNCDGGLNQWSSDEGWLTDMSYLPVRSLRSGDTGSVSDDKQAKITLGPLICKGDALHTTSITFRLADASIQFPLELEGYHLLESHSWDIYFEFKTTTRNAVILHSKGPTDFVKVELINGNLIKFQVESGSGPLGVNVRTTNTINNDEWHSVHVEKNRKQLRIVLDGSQSSSILQPPGQQRSIFLTTDLFVGSTVDNRDGYVGCVRSLLVNGVMFDLKQVVNDKTYGVGLGCIGKCSSGPCLNNGTCDEGYDKYTCDCRFTSFKGPICADEIGVNLQSNNFIKYDLYGSYKSTIAERLRVGFTTTEPKGFLVGLFSNKTGEYLTLMVSNSGHLRLVFDFGFERQELIFPDHNFATGQYHDVQISRFDSGTKLIMKVDNLEPKIYPFDVKASADAQFNNIEYLYIGKNESMREGFIGCISRVEFDDQYPLKYYFQENRPKTIRSYPEDIVEDFCGVEPVTHPAEIPESRPLPQLDEEKLRKIYNASATLSGILGGILAIIFLLIVIFAVLIGRYWSQHKGQYLTQEDDGANCEDVNDAVVKGSTGHHVAKKKEWFI